MTFNSLSEMDKLKCIAHWIPFDAHMEVQKRVAVVALKVYGDVNPPVDDDLNTPEQYNPLLAEALEKLIRPHKYITDEQI